MNHKGVKKIAQEIRTEFEKNSIDPDVLINLYKKYNPSVKQTRLFVRKSKKLFPNLNCGLATIYLKKTIGEGKIIHGKYRNEKHTFLLLGKNTIVDITADQYGGPRVYVGQLRKPWSLI